jgi:cytochrome P450
MIRSESVTGTPTLALPPGTLGLPYLGETLAFLRNPFRFLEDRQRRHGHVWKSRLLGRRIVFLSGTEGAQAFYDPRNISREDAHPFPLVDLFGGINMEMYDGPRHQALKGMALTAFDLPAIGGYLPAMQQLLEQALAGLAVRDEWQAVAELRKLAIEALCQNVVGLGRGPETDAICRDYALMLQGLVSVPVALPGTPYGRARAARNRLLAILRRTIAERRQVPGNDALSRILQATAPDGRTFTDEEALLEVHHIFVAGYIVYALMGEGLRRLAEDPALLARARAEVQAQAAAGPLTMQALSRLPVLTRVVQETKRFVPLVPLAFGRAKREFEVGGRRVPSDWTVYLALTLCNRDPAIYRDPDRFDPDRFGPDRAEHRKHALAFIPQGAEPPQGHRCLGLDYSTFLTLTFLTLLVRNYRWELPDQDLSYNWKTLPPEPRDGLRVQLRAR